jgi:hypothetical protein
MTQSSAALELSRRTPRRLAAGPVLIAAFLAAIGPTDAAPDTKTFESTQFRYSVSMPTGCRHEEGPGTLDAICSADLDPEKSTTASAASALVLEVGVEQVPADAGASAAELAQRYDETQFKEELAEAVCGEADNKAKVKVSDAKQVLDDTRVVYMAGIVCPEIRFLGLGERSARVRFLITPGARYLLMARAQKEEFEKHKETVDAFFASFRILP